MKTILLSIVLLTVTSLVSCTPNQSSPLGVIKGEMRQNLTVGQIRAAITEHYATQYSINVCFNGSSPNTAVILSGSQTLALIQSWGYDTSSSPLSSYFDPLYDNKARAVKVVVNSGEVSIETVFIPDVTLNTQGVFVDKNRPQAGQDETCVSCEYEQGQKPAPCTCTRKTKTVCGANPQIACTEECTFCPTGSSYFDVAQGICDLNNSGPFGSTTPFPDLPVAASLL